MERIRLSKQEKQVLRLLHGGIFHSDALFAACVYSLERKGLAKGAWASGHTLVDARLTESGETYMVSNPSLRNPVDWKWIITATLLTVTAITGIIALFIACNKIN